MASLKMRALITRDKTSENQPIDPIPGLFRELARLNHITGNHLGPDSLRTRLMNHRTVALDRTILCTPAASLEGVVRQLQILGSDLNSSGLDPDNIELGSMALAQLWMAIYGALNQLLPLVPPVENDGFYNLALIETCPDEALGLFRKMLEGVGQ